MKSSLITLAVAVGLVTAQLPQLDKIPTCAYGCVSKYITGTNIAGCKPADIACVCKNKDFIGGISCCLQDACSKADVDSTISFASQLCNASGVDTPKQLVCSSGAASSGPTSSSGAAATKTDNSSSGATATGSQQTTTAPSATASGSASAATTPATSTHTGAAAPAFGNAGGILGAALAIAAAL